MRVAPDSPPIATSGQLNGQDRPIETITRLELVKIAYAEMVSGTIASTGTALVFAIVMAARSASFSLCVWLATVLLIAGYRFGLAMGFRRQPLTDESARKWGLRFVISTTATGLCWGATAWIFPTLMGGGPTSAVHMLILAGVTTGSTRLLLPMRKGSIAYLLAVMGPVSLRFFAEADLVGAALGGCTVFFIVYVANANVRSYRVFSEALVLRFERESLAADLTAENERRQAREAELREARERAESANRAKGEFLATISHEIRTPLNGVLGMLRVLHDTPVSPEQQGYLKTASDSAESLLILLNDVLDFSKIEAGKLDLEQAAFSPATMIRAVGDLMRPRARDKGLRFEVKTTDLPSAVVGDASRLRQILVNLIGNAIKFTERGSVELLAAGMERSAGSVAIEFVVADSGIGIGTEALELLFKPFSQVDASMARRYGGTGLGLAISQRIANAMGGTITVRSNVGQGSKFRLNLTFALPEVSRTPISQPKSTFVAPSLEGRVLVVEDDAVNQKVIDLFLKKMNLTPSFAADGEAAIAAASRDAFDLVLMDCQLPGIDGLEATRQIRQRLHDRRLPIVALTANANTHMREACLAAGMDDFLSKPVQFELLASVLKRNLRELQPSPSELAAT